MFLTYKLCHKLQQCAFLKRCSRSDKKDLHSRNGDLQFNERETCADYGHVDGETKPRKVSSAIELVQFLLSNL